MQYWKQPAKQCCIATLGEAIFIPRLLWTGMQSHVQITHGVLALILYSWMGMWSQEKHLTSAWKPQSHRYPKRQGRLVISDLTRGLRAWAIFSLVKGSATLLRLQFLDLWDGLDLWNGDYPFVIFCDTLWGEYSWLPSTAVRMRHTRHSDGVSFPR